MHMQHERLCARVWYDLGEADEYGGQHESRVSRGGQSGEWDVVTDDSRRRAEQQPVSSRSSAAYTDRCDWLLHEK